MLTSQFRFLPALALWSGVCCAQVLPDMPPGFGPRPALPAPAHALFPTVNTAKAAPWTGGAKPTAAPGLVVQAYAEHLLHPRQLYVLPNGDVLVAETNAPAKPETPGLRGMIERHLMKGAGAVGDSADRITLLRGLNAAGGAAQRTVFVSGLHSPYGMALVGKDFYVANTDAVLRFSYRAGETSLTGEGVKLLDLPAGSINHHWTKNLVASPDGKRLYIAVGSNSNVGENGMAQEEGRAAIWEYTIATGQARIYASGLRNPVGMGFEPGSGALWVAVNERDELGDDLVPDYMTAVHDGAFYGWPYSYFGQHVDDRVKPQRPDLVKSAVAPDYALGAHTASLGLAFYDKGLLPRLHYGVLIGQHGSWNRSVHSGYKLIFIPFSHGRPIGPPQDVLSGFLSPQGQARGRPVGVAVAHDGAVLLADDVGNVVWRVSSASP